MANEQKIPPALPASSEEKLLSLVAESNMQLLTQLMPAMAALFADAQAKSFDVAEQRKTVARDLGPTCGECGQRQKACKGKHRKANLWPKTRLGLKHHQGIYLNSVRYYQETPHGYVTVPEDCNVEYMLACDEAQLEDCIHGKEQYLESGYISHNSTAQSPGSGFRHSIPNSAMH